MKLKTIILVPLITLIVMIILNAVFHTVVAASFFDKEFASFGNAVKSVKETNPALLSLVEATWVCTLFYLLSLNKPAKIKTGQAIIGGMLINASICGTWNFINASMFPVYPVGVILPDMAWHVLVIGSIAGLLISGLYNKFEV
jgi:predicted membrane protein DUF2177